MIAAAAAASALSGETTGTLLDGRVAYMQLRDGYRTGIEPVLLAACVPAGPGDRVVEGGTGAGAGLLCLAARVPGVTGIGLEIDPVVAQLASRNFSANGHPPGPEGLRACAKDVTEWRATEAFDHAFANPPWHKSEGTASPSEGRRTAKIAPGGLLGDWSASLAAGLRRRGTLSLILPATSLAQGVCALQDADCAEMDILPLWPRHGDCARLVVLRGVRGGRGGSRLLPGLVLHGGAGGYTDAAETVLRLGRALL